ncbi:MAG: hypothetical protein RLZZ436_2479 [Planctomycetota bacterium]|jgi:hypothetical protein
MMPALCADDLFSTQVAPLLQRKCLSCHNSEDRKGEFSLQTAAELAGSGMVQPGAPDDSQLLHEVLSHDGQPPEMPKDGKPLTAAETDLLRRWIAAGAGWPEGVALQPAVIQDFSWWSFQPLQAAVPPTLSDAAAAAWIRNPIDAFVLDTMRRQGLQPAPEADRRTLIRRLSFDLLGLPPTPAEVEAFVADPDPHAYEQLVDRMLAAPQYGERWARYWLDIVRYADTCGYDKDKLRPNAWPYRDYVIKAFNTDKPYGRFVEEQVAGDVLYPGDPDGILGLGFIAAGPWDFIGHVEVPEAKFDGQVARNLDRDDMVSGTLNAFCSLTIQCARCHNHKFDPFTQEHYYGLQAVFAAVDRADRLWDADPEVERQRRELTEAKQAAVRGRDELQAAIRREGGKPLEELEAEVARLKPLAEPPAKKPEYGYHSQIAGSAMEQKWVQVDLGEDRPVRSIVLHPCHDEFGGIGAGFGFPVRFRVEVADAAGAALTPPVFRTVLDQSAADFANPGLNAVAAQVVDGNVRLLRVTAVRLAPRSNDYIFSLAELEALDADGKNLATGAKVQGLDSIEAGPRWSQANLTDGIWPAAADPAAAVAYKSASDRLQQRMQELLTEERQQQQTAFAEAIAAADRGLAALPTGRMVYAAATHFTPQGNFQPTQGRPRTIRVLHRGNESQPRQEVVPGTVPLQGNDAWQFPLAADHSEGDRRAALAKWITRPDHPLTWRSIVNRIWQAHFGRAIVDSPNDFGRMGQLPTHPELLDWLAAEFLRNGQSFKAMHRLLVTSSTWRQSSQTTGEQLQIDADNRWLSRMTRRRLTAEELRDAVLAVSGRLNPEMGGPGFYLFELEKTDHSPHYEYHKFNPADPKSHRRSIYRFIVRSQPDPFMTTLDCADSSQSTPRRHETTTALQALSLLNNRFNLVMAGHFAERVEQLTENPGDRVTLAFQLATCRRPAADEQQQLEAFVQQHGLPALCRLLVNLNEFVFVE